MAFLRTLILMALITGCGPQTISQTQLVETDTYISSSDSSAHADLNYLKISKSASSEERILMKLPTVSTDSDVVGEMLKESGVWVFFMPLIVISELLECHNQIVRAENISKSELVIDVLDTLEADLTGKLQLDLLTRPWWQRASWNRAHYFSATKGAWATPGGDVDVTWLHPTFTVSGSSLHFDITNYIKELINLDGKGIHYGFLIQSSIATLASTRLKSSQYENTSTRPRLITNFTGTCYGAPATFRSTFILGSDPTRVSQPPEKIQEKIQEKI